MLGVMGNTNLLVVILADEGCLPVILDYWLFQLTTASLVRSIRLLSNSHL
jgi:hypothetical protein